MIAFYYSLTGFTCVWYFRRRFFSDVRTAVLVGFAPLVGGAALAWVFAKSAISLANPDNTGGRSVLGVGSPVVIAIGGLVLGLLLMQLQRGNSPSFFNAAPEAASPVGASSFRAEEE